MLNDNRILPQILIHTCCADCLINLIAALDDEKIINKQTAIVLLFYNPNIHPRSEYLERLNALKKVIAEKYPFRNIKLVIPEYRPKEYFENIQGKEKRCLGCWEVRLTKTFEWAKMNNIHDVSSTLLSSHYQDTETIKAIARKLEDKDTHLVYPLNIHSQLNNKGFYKQNFCGCCYSLTERLWEKYHK